MGIKTIFDITTPKEFEVRALEIYKFQYAKNKVYQEFCDHLNQTPKNVHCLQNIPFLPIAFFKTKQIHTEAETPKTIFTSSGTAGVGQSRHYVRQVEVYETSFLKAFELFYGPTTNYCILALLPSYLERKGSSLIYMVDALIKKTGHPDSGFHLQDFNALKDKLHFLEASGTKTLLIGVSFALLDFCHDFAFPLKNTLIMETGGMKGRRKEMVREELHRLLTDGFKVNAIHSEYGMTELLSQAYSKGNGIFQCPPWMRVLARDTEDPFSYQAHGKTGGLNIIDLANIHSCSFIATQDLGKVYSDGSFEVLGRFDHADIRGCNLMII